MILLAALLHLAFGPAGLIGLAVLFGVLRR